MNSIQHIALNCRDHIASESFYTRHFGFRRARVFNAGQPNEFVMLRLGAACIELFNCASENHAACGGEQPVGFKHLAFEVPNLEASIEQLRGDGIEPDPIIDCGNITHGLRVCFFRDPDGNILELMQSWRDQEI